MNTNDLMDDVGAAAHEIRSAVSTIEGIIKYGGYDPALDALPIFQKAMEEATALYLLLMEAKSQRRRR